jgi:hypothetical protein
VNGSVAEALRHPTVRRLNYVELDPKILDLARRRFPEEWSAIGSDSRVHVHSGDGRFFLKTTAGSFDVIIVNLPDPRTAQLNRFYTLEFFREAARRLNPGGLVSVHLSGAENYIGPELAGFLRSIHKTLRLVFPSPRRFPAAPSTSSPLQGRHARFGVTSERSVAESAHDVRPRVHLPFRMTLTVSRISSRRYNRSPNACTGLHRIATFPWCIALRAVSSRAAAFQAVA